ncbi:MAG: hypothetical protein PWP23_2150 [Candidatus Sumerlaeota bacterium]|nr:hypothetical protein [Candidatus Sumerlaeota bacterium]
MAKTTNTFSAAATDTASKEFPPMTRLRTRFLGTLLGAALLAGCTPLSNDMTLNQLQDSAPSASTVSTGAESLDELGADISELMKRTDSLLDFYAQEAMANTEFKEFSDDTAGMAPAQAKDVYAALPPETQEQIKSFAGNNILMRKLGEAGELKETAVELRSSFNHALDDVKTGKIAPENYLKAMQSTGVMREQLTFVDNTLKFLQGQASILETVSQLPVGTTTTTTGTTDNETVYK